MTVGHSNIVVDDTYRILGVTDWKTAFAGPWDVFGDVPSTLSTVLDTSWNYDEDGCP